MNRAHTTLIPAALASLGTAILCGTLVLGAPAHATAATSGTPDTAASATPSEDAEDATGAAESGPVDTTETSLELAELVSRAWDDSPVYVDEAMSSEVNAATEESFTTKIDAAADPTFLAVLPLDYTDDLDAMATMLASVHGVEGTYIVEGTDAVGHKVTVTDEDRMWLLDSQFYQGSFDPDYRMSETEWVTHVLDRLADPQEAPETEYTPIDELQYQMQYRPLVFWSVLAGIVLVLVGVAFGIGLFNPRRRRKYKVPSQVIAAATQASRQQLQKMLGDDALRISENLQKLKTEGLEPAQQELVEHGLDAYDLARRIADDESSQQDDLAGALALFNQAERDLEEVETSTGNTERRRRGRRGKQKSVPERPRTSPLCTVNPRHGESQGSAEITAPTAGISQVPLCSACLTDRKNDATLQWLRVDGKPYPDRDTVWAATLYGATEADLVEEVIRARAMR